MWPSDTDDTMLLLPLSSFTPGIRMMNIRAFPSTVPPGDVSLGGVSNGLTRSDSTTDPNRTEFCRINSVVVVTSSGSAVLCICHVLGGDVSELILISTIRSTTMMNKTANNRRQDFPRDEYHRVVIPTADNALSYRCKTQSPLVNSTPFRSVYGTRQRVVNYTGHKKTPKTHTRVHNKPP